MQDYEVYLIHGFCESEWQYLGRVRAISKVRARLQALRDWPEYPPDLLAVFPVDIPVTVAV